MWVGIGLSALMPLVVLVDSGFASDPCLLDVTMVIAMVVWGFLIAPATAVAFVWKRDWRSTVGWLVLGLAVGTLASLVFVAPMSHGSCQGFGLDN